MKLLLWLWPSAHHLENARRLVELLSKERDELKKRNEALWVIYNQAEAAKNGFRAEFEKAQAKLRKQNEADLILVSAKIIMDVLNGGNPSNQAIALQQSLLAQQNNALRIRGNYQWP